MLSQPYASDHASSFFCLALHPVAGAFQGCSSGSTNPSPYLTRHVLVQGPHAPPAPCHCNPRGPWQTALFQDALGDISRCPSLLYSALKSTGIRNLAMGVWKLNLLPPLAVLSCHLWSQSWKGCSHCKRACNHHLRGGGKLPLQRCLPALPLGSFLPEYNFAPQKPLWWMKVVWRGGGWNWSTAHLYVLCFLSNSGSVILAMRCQLLPQVEELPSRCACVFVAYLQQP